MSSNQTVCRPLVSAGLTVFLLLSAPIRAEIEEVIVTAQKRAESAQDVPISVSAFDMEALEERQIDTFSDLQFNVPNVSYSKGQFSGNNFQIRGIGTLLTATSADSGVAMHVNDVYIHTPRIFETEYYDMEQVEILRGPQGTLFGRNATGGAVNLKTARPELDKLYGDIEAQYGNFDHTKFKSAVNIPLGERVAARVAGIYLNREGYTDDLISGDDIDDRDQWSVRGSIRFQIADGTTLDIIAHRFEEDSSRSRSQKQLCHQDPSPIIGCLPDSLDFEPVNIFSTSSVLASSNLVLSAFGLGAFGLFDFFAQNPNPDFGNPGDLRDVRLQFKPEYEAEEDFLMAELVHELNDALTLTVIGAYQETEVESRQDFNGTAADSGSVVLPPGFCTVFSPAACTYYGMQEGGPVFLSTVPDEKNSLGAIAGAGEFELGNRGSIIDLSRRKGKQWSAESRLSTSFDGPVNFLFAGYYLEYETDSDYFVQSPGLDYASLVLGNAAAGFVGNPNQFVSLTPGFFDSLTYLHELESFAVFGEMYWDINDSMKLTLGLRYTEDEKFVRDRQLFLNVPVLVDVPTSTTTYLGSDGSVVPVSNINQLFSAAAAVGDYDADPNLAGGQVFREDDVTFDEFTGRIVLDWTPELGFTDDTLVYFSYSRGYKGGGINPPIDTSLFPNTPTSFEPEEIDAYEIGTKNLFWERRAQLNGAVFYYDYSGLQIGKIINRTSLNENTDADIFGMELEFLLQPTDNWQFNAQVSYLDTELGRTATIDPRDPTQGRQDVTLIKDVPSASNCVLEHNGQVPASQNAAFVGSMQSAALYIPTGVDLGGGFSLPSTPGVTDSAISSCVAAQILGPLNGYGYLDSVPIDLKGNELLNAPELTVSLGAQYTWFLNNGMSLTARVDYYWQDEFYSTTFNRAQDLVDDWDIINAQIMLNGKDGRWFARAFIQNLEDEDHFTGSFQADPSVGMFTNVFLVEPRLYGLTLGVRMN